MRIAVDTRFLQGEEDPQIRDFAKEVFERLLAQHTEHEFIFLRDKALSLSAYPAKNVTYVIITSRPINFLLYKWWNDVKVSRALNKYNADIFIATYSIASLASKVKQLLIVKDLAFLKTTNFSKANSFYKRYMFKFIKKANAVATLTETIKNELSHKYKTGKENIVALGAGYSILSQPIEWQQREVLKERIAGGFEYFVLLIDAYCTASFLPVLKAFSIFKKWQKSGLKLLVIIVPGVTLENELEKLVSYKFREEVIIKKELTEQHIYEIIACSYAFIFPSVYGGFPVPVLGAMRCEVPVITTNNNTMHEIAGEAALYVNIAHPAEIAEQMKKIYKDEQLRNKLIEAGKLSSDRYSWDKTADQLWQLIQQVYSN